MVSRSEYIYIVMDFRWVFQIYVSGSPTTSRWTSLRTTSTWRRWTPWSKVWPDSKVASSQPGRAWGTDLGWSLEPTSTWHQPTICTWRSKCLSFGRAGALPIFFDPCHRSSPMPASSWTKSATRFGRWKVASWQRGPSGTSPSEADAADATQCETPAGFRCVGNFAETSSSCPVYHILPLVSLLSFVFGNLKPMSQIAFQPFSLSAAQP